MGTPSTVPTPKTFVISLSLVSGSIQAQGDFENQMVINDIARFVSPVPGDILIEFTSLPATTTSGSSVPANLLPFGVDKIVNPKPSQDFKVVNSCRSMMSVTINATDGRTVSCAWDESGDVLGTAICTGGGDSPVRCP